MKEPRSGFPTFLTLRRNVRNVEHWWDGPSVAMSGGSEDAAEGARELDKVEPQEVNHAPSYSGRRQRARLVIRKRRFAGILAPGEYWMFTFGRGVEFEPTRLGPKPENIWGTRV